MPGHPVAHLFWEDAISYCGQGVCGMTGNVWERVNDWYAPECFHNSSVDNPQGPSAEDQKVQCGGSWLCSENYCQGSPVAARMTNASDSGLNNLGVPCAASAP